MTFKPNRRARRALGIERQQTVEEYFFERGGDGVIRPRRDLVRRDELWGVLEWYHRRVTRENVWYKVLWRWLKGAALTRIDPFRLWPLRKAEKELER